MKGKTKNTMKKIALMLGVLAILFLAGCSTNQGKSESKSRSKSSVVVKHKKPAKKKSVKKENAKSSQSSQAQSQNKQNQEKKPEQTAPAVKKMNFAQIQNGDFSSLSGTWKLVKRISHHKDLTADSNGEILNVTPTMISNSDMSLSKDGIKGADQVMPVKYSMQGDALVANLADETVAINYVIYFYPTGAKNMQIDGEVQTPPTKNTIVTWSSSLNTYSVYEQQ